MLEEIEDSEDRLAVLGDCLLDMRLEQTRYLLSMAETMCIIDGVSPITVWREKRGMTVAELAGAVGVGEEDLGRIENGGNAKAPVLEGIAAVLEVLPNMLTVGGGLPQA